MSGFEIRPGGGGCGCGGCGGEKRSRMPFEFAPQLDASTRLTGTSGHGFAGLLESAGHHLEVVGKDLLSKAHCVGQFTNHTAADLVNGNPVFLLDVLRAYPGMLEKLDVVIRGAGSVRSGTQDECSSLLQQRSELERALRDLRPYAEQTESLRNECRDEAMRGSRGPARLCSSLGAQYVQTCNQDSNSEGCRSAYAVWQACLDQRLSPTQVASGCDNLGSSEPGPGGGAIGAFAASVSEIIRRSIREIDRELVVCRMGAPPTNFGPGVAQCRNQAGYERCRRGYDNLIVGFLILLGIAFLFEHVGLVAVSVAALVLAGVSRWLVCREYCL